MMDQKQIDTMAEALRSQGLTWSQTNFAVSLVRNAQAAERERIRALVEAVRDANAASQDADDCLIYTAAVHNAWATLMDGLEGPNV